MASEDSSEQVEVRKQKLEKLKAAGVSVYPNDFKPTYSAAALVAGFTAANDDELAAAPKVIRVAGRIMAIRRMGKASFFHLHDRRARLQVYIQQNAVGEEKYGLFRS
ncbi:MAG: OB-fold nucleic acid binding domain-containing protein, partial [Candidatus Binatia bacterium]